jgi:arsenate reductase
MAESLINQLGKGRYEAASAGSFPTGYVHPESIEALKRNVIDVGEPRSKSWDEYAGEAFDLVITVCDQAASESCPVILGEYQTLHWSTPDPAKAEGTDEDIRRAFDDAFQMFKRRIRNELL